MARHATALEAAVEAYQHVRAWYGGELLPGREHRYAWLDEPIKGELTPRSLYAQLRSEATQRLAELLSTCAEEWHVSSG